MEQGDRTNSPNSNISSQDIPSTINEQVMMKLNLMEMSLSLIQGQINSSLCQLNTMVKGLYDQVEGLNTRIMELERAQETQEITSKQNKPVGTSNINMPSKQVHEEKKKVEQAEARQVLLSQAPISQTAESSQQTTQLPIGRITPFKEIVRAQASAKDKEVARPNTASSEKNNSRTFDLIEQYQYYRMLTQKLNHLALTTKTVKYVSHYAFNKVVVYPGTQPELVRTLYGYGLIQTMYPSNNLQELIHLPKPIQEAAKHYAAIVTQYRIYIRFYSTLAEITPEKFYPPINLIRFGTTKKPFEFEEEVKEEVEEEEFQSRISIIRAQEMNIIFQEMNRTITSDEAQWTYFAGPTTCIYSVGKNSKNQKLFTHFYDKIKTNTIENSERTRRNICRVLSEYHPTHRCNYCGDREKEDRDYETPIMDQSIL